MKPENIAKAHSHGPDRRCQHCGTAYRSPRASSRYCGAACRKAANRAAKSRTTPEGSVILRALVRLGMAGKISAAEWGLTVPRSAAFAELALVFDRKGWGALTEGEFSASLAADCVKTR